MVSTTLQAQNRADTPANTQHALATGHLGPYLMGILQGPAHKEYRLARGLVGTAEHLGSLGFYKSRGMNPAISHWRLELPDGQEIHVQEQDDHYAVHWDHVSLRRDPIGHGIRDAPGVMLGLGLLALALFGKGELR